MSFRRSRRDSDWGWSEWEWNSSRRRMTRFKPSGTGTKWEYKNKNGKIESAFVEGTQTCNSNLEDDSTGRYASEIAVIDEEENVEDDESVGTVNQGFSNLTMQTPQLPQWSSSNTAQRQWQDNLNSNQYSPAPSTNQDTLDNTAAISFSSKSSSPQQGSNPEPRWASMSGRTAYTIKPNQTSTSFENKDKNFKVYDTKRFTFGKVFKIMWSEPTGSQGTAITLPAPPKSGKPFAKMRRFVVVKSYSGHSLCLPILTYSNQGTTKRGVHVDDHAMIYASKEAGRGRPDLLPGEQLKKKALRMVPENESHKLDPASRVNYAKVYTVEHNVKVQFIGKLSTNSCAQLSADYNAQHPPIEETKPEPGYVVQRSGMENHAFSQNQSSGDMQVAPDYAYQDLTTTQPVSGYGVPSVMGLNTDYTNAQTSYVNSTQDFGYTTERPSAAGYLPNQYPSTNQALRNSSYQTPRTPPSEPSFRNTEDPIQQLQYSPSVAPSGLSPLYRTTQGHQAEIFDPPLDDQTDGYGHQQP